jgi:hypothetical protein
MRFSALSITLFAVILLSSEVGFSPLPVARADGGKSLATEAAESKSDKKEPWRKM